MFRLSFILQMALLACLALKMTNTQNDESSPFCEPPKGEICECMEEILQNQLGCPPCVCATSQMCQSCICPTTMACQCICVDPTLTDDDRTDQLPRLNSTQADEAFMEMADVMQGIDNELKANSTQIKNCFTKKNKVFKKIKAVRSAAQAARDAAMTAAEMVRGRDSLDDPKIIKQIDVVINALDFARKKHEELVRAGATAIEKKSDVSIADHSDPMSTVLALNGYQPTGECLIAKTIIVEWHPAYWFWYYPYKWSIFHRFWYYWFCAWYIRFIIYFKVWWWWIWRPWGWPWFWPWRWCYWWPLSWWGWIW